MAEDTTKLESLDCNSANNHSNKNLMIVQEIQGLVLQITEKLYSLTIKTDKQKAVRGIAAEEIGLFEKTTLSELQEVFA